MQVKLHIEGMHCIHCQNKIEEALQNTVGVDSVKVSYTKGIAQIVFDETKTSIENLKETIEALDYRVRKWNETQKKDYTRTVCLMIIIISFYTILQRMGILNALVPSKLADSQMGYGMLFVIGLLTSMHCIAMCGGINLSQCLQSTQKSGVEGKFSYFPTILYNLGRVVSYTTIGFVLGFAGLFLGGGTEIGISAFLQGVLKIVAGFFMVIMGINMLDIFPFLRKFTIRPPKALSRLLGKRKAKTKQPFIIGLCNGLMPCGPLQSMWIVAFATANPVAGGLSMFLFSLGTVPLMLGLGSIVTAIGKKAADKMLLAGAVLVVVLGLGMLSQGSALSGIGIPASWISQNTEIDNQAQIIDGVQIVESTLQSGQYPNISVKAGIPVRWIINAPEGSINGCNYKFQVPEYGIVYSFSTGENIIAFTPTEKGSIPYTCWMGMIRGKIQIKE